MKPALIQCRGLLVGYEGRAVLPPIDVDVRAGSFVVVAGRNGSGKSTWFRTALGLLPPVGGSLVRADSVRPTYMPQRMRFDDLTPVTVAQVVGMGTLRGWSFLRPGGGAQAAAAMERLGITSLAGRTFRSLSEGQKQKVLLARIVASGANIALLDEPTAAMDHAAERETLEVLASLHRELGLAVVVVSHHLAAAVPFATDAIFFDPDAGQVVAGSAREVFRHPAFLARHGELHLG